MANQKHLELLSQGVAVWNAWREEHPTIEADLREANLTSARLAGTTLTSAHLAGTTLTSAHLRGATLTSATLDGATLTDADLAGTTLTRGALGEEQVASARNTDSIKWVESKPPDEGSPPP